MPEACLVIGRVIPERKSFKHESLRLDVKDPRFNIDACVILRVQDGQLIARIVGDIGHLSNFALKRIVSQAEESWLNAHAFIHGEVFHADIIGIVRDDANEADESAKFHYQDNYHDIIQSRNRQVDLNEVWNLCRSDKHLRRALNDLRMALAYVDDGPFYCYRALETVRRDIAGKDHPNNKAAQWDHMWQILGGSQAEKAFFEKLATDIRHGEDVVYPGEQWRQAVLSAWNIVERYMLQRLRGH